MGAGTIIVKWDGGWKVLALEANFHIKKKNGGIYDVPKGQIDKGENAWQTAIRETFEEAGIILGHEEVIAGPYKDNWLTLWVCEVLPSEKVTLEPNPHSGILEHESYHWLSFDEMKKGCYSYLKQFIILAEEDVNNMPSIYLR